MEIPCISKVIISYQKGWENSFCNRAFQTFSKDPVYKKVRVWSSGHQSKRNKSGNPTRLCLINFIGLPLHINQTMFLFMFFKDSESGSSPAKRRRLAKQVSSGCLSVLSSVHLSASVCPSVRLSFLYCVHTRSKHV